MVKYGLWEVYKRAGSATSGSSLAHISRTTVASQGLRSRRSLGSTCTPGTEALNGTRFLMHMCAAVCTPSKLASTYMSRLVTRATAIGEKRAYIFEMHMCE